MQVLHVIGSMNPRFGGPGQVVRNSIQELDKLGVCNEVVCLDDPSESFFRTDLFKTYALGPWKSPWYYTSKLLPWLLDNLERFDVIIVHGIWLYHTYAINKALRIYRTSKSESKKSAKIFIMPHGMLDPYFQQAPERKLKAVRNWVYWKLIEGKVINDADGVLFTCEQELRLARQAFRPYKPKREINVGSGIAAPPSFTLKMQKEFSALLPDLNDCPYLLFLGRIHEKKGIDMLITAYASLIKKMSEKKLIVSKLVIAGPGLETLYGQKIQRMAFENPDLSDSILFADMLIGDAKWGAFYGCDAFALPSHQENFGIATVEAMACGKAVLISDQVNIWKEIKETGGGLIAEDSLKGIDTMLSKWFNLSDNEKKEMGHRAKICYEKHFAIASAVKVLLNAIKN